MKLLSAILFACLSVVSTSAQQIVVNHNSLSLFPQIPEQYLGPARAKRVLFMDQSVGLNLHGALNCLTKSSYSQAANVCRRDYIMNADGTWTAFLRTDPNTVHPYIQFFPDPIKYTRANWKYYYHYQGGSWQDAAKYFIKGLHNGIIQARMPITLEPVNLNVSDFDVLSFQFSYLHIAAGSTAGQFFTELPGEFDDAYDLEREMNEHFLSEGKQFFYWTTSLGRSIGTAESESFNNTMRAWANLYQRPLLDFSDIEAFDKNSGPCFDDRDGVLYSGTNGAENYPDDGLLIPAVCQEKTTEINGGHLVTAQGTVSAIKGFWIMMARLSGWNQ
ncbi:hypothetical protein HY346_00970 [Candidatus Microgenomates bacterium]|nr:hypothetical protein [Candidatus Microgenomates bacterium]